EVVQEQDNAGDRQQDRGGDNQRPIHGGGSLSLGALYLGSPGTLHMPQAASTALAPQAAGGAPTA
ncbi:MAG TPA: hypothetical protein VGW74_18615, partial [Propionibacteriaceae bacterium]|nr:hypothetical protein [Propionibacteriaceae bacterium]